MLKSLSVDCGAMQQPCIDVSLKCQYISAAVHENRRKTVILMLLSNFFTSSRICAQVKVLKMGVTSFY